MIFSINLLFYTFILFILFFFILFFFSRHPINSSIYLIILILCFSFLLLLLGFEFFGFLFLLIYIGAISIFFLLVIMLINVESIVIQLTSKRFVVVQIIFVSSLLGVFMLFYLFFNDILIVLFNNDQDFFLRNVFFTLYTDHIDLLGQLLFTKYGLWTFFFGILLLIILIISLILLNNNWYTSMRLEK